MYFNTKDPVNMNYQHITWTASFFGTAFHDQEFSEITLQISETTLILKSESIITQELFAIWIASINFNPCINSPFEHWARSKSSSIDHDRESAGTDVLKRENISLNMNIRVAKVVADHDSLLTQWRYI